jgi:ERCC4-type nuclease
MIIAPTEPKEFLELGVVGSAPEQFGADFLFPIVEGPNRGSLIGIQRKELSDLVASIRDGRLSKELLQMATSPLSGKYLLVEGTVRETNSGNLYLGRRASNFSFDSFRGILLGIQAQNCHVIYSESVDDSVRRIKQLESFWNKEHFGLSRPKPSGDWGKADTHEFQIHILTSFPGVGRKMAERILSHFNGIPIHWDCEEWQLTEIEGIGDKKAKSIYQCLRGKNGTRAL